MTIIRWKDNSKKFWDVIGDGWNPGHTMTEQEIKNYEEDYEKSTCGSGFGPGWYDRERGIMWRYTNKPMTIPPGATMDSIAIGERLVLLATQGLDHLNIYEVEPNE